MVPYYNARRGDKPVITKRIVRLVKQSGGRFLQKVRSRRNSSTSKRVTDRVVEEHLHLHQLNHNDHLRVLLEEEGKGRELDGEDKFMEIDEKSAMAKTSQTFRDVIAAALKNDPKTFDGVERDTGTVTPQDYDELQEGRQIHQQPTTRQQLQGIIGGSYDQENHALSSAMAMQWLDNNSNVATVNTNAIAGGGIGGLHEQQILSLMNHLQQQQHQNGMISSISDPSSSMNEIMSGHQNKLLSLGACNKKELDLFHSAEKLGEKNQDASDDSILFQKEQEDERQTNINFPNGMPSFVLDNAYSIATGSMTIADAKDLEHNQRSTNIAQPTMVIPDSNMSTGVLEDRVEEGDGNFDGHIGTSDYDLLPNGGNHEIDVIKEGKLLFESYEEMISSGVVSTEMPQITLSDTALWI